MSLDLLAALVQLTFFLSVFIFIVIVCIIFSDDGRR